MLLPYLMQDTKRIRVIGSVRLTNSQGESPTKHNPKAQPTEQRTNHSQPHPSPPRPDTSSQSQLTPPTPPALPAFPILQTRSNKPINQHPADQRPQQEGNTEYSPTLHFTIKEQPRAPEWEQQQQDDITAHVPREQPEHLRAQAKGKQHTSHTAQTVQQISSEGEEDDDQEMAEQSDQDVEMESAHPDTEEIDDPEGKPANSTDITNQQKELQNTQSPPQQKDQQATKDMQQDQERRRHATGREVMQAARPLQLLLRKKPEQPHHEPNPATQTPAKDHDAQPCPTPPDPNSKQDSDPISPLPTPILKNRPRSTTAIITKPLLQQGHITKTPLQPRNTYTHSTLVHAMNLECRTRLQTPTCSTWQARSTRTS